MAGTTASTITAYRSGCPYCNGDDAGRAGKAGATEPELAEAAMVAAVMRAGARVAQATHVVR